MALISSASVRSVPAPAGRSSTPSISPTLVARATPGGEVRRFVTFAGTLNDMLKGWYRSTYRDANGGERVIATFKDAALMAGGRRADTDEVAAPQRRANASPPGRHLHRRTGSGR